MAKEDKKQPALPLTDADGNLLTDDQGSPDMGLGLDLSVGGEGGKGEGPDTGTPDLSNISPELHEYMVKHGLKSPSELAATLKSLEQKNTELGQENRVLSMRPIPQQAPPPPATGRKKISIPEDPYNLMTDKTKFNSFIQEIDQVIEDRANEAVNKHDFERLTRQRDKLATRDPVKFEKLRPVMHQLSQTEEFGRSDINELYTEAEKRMPEIEKLTGENLAKQLGLDPDDVKNIKVLTAKMRPAPISGAPGGGQQAAVGTPADEAAKKIKEGILGSNQLNE